MPTERPLIPLPSLRSKGRGAAKAARAVGVLGGSSSHEGGSVWLETEQTTIAVIWPYGYCARFHPLELLDDEGHVIATGGDTIAITGGYRQEGHPDDHLVNVVPGMEHAFVAMGPVEVVDGNTPLR